MTRLHSTTPGTSLFISPFPNPYIQEVTELHVPSIHLLIFANSMISNPVTLPVTSITYSYCEPPPTHRFHLQLSHPSGTSPTALEPLPCKCTEPFHHPPPLPSPFLSSRFDSWGARDVRRDHAICTPGDLCCMAQAENARRCGSWGGGSS